MKMGAPIIATNKEEDIIQELLIKFSGVHPVAYEWLLSNETDKEMRELFIEGIKIMHGLGFIAINYNGQVGQNIITLTSLGRSVVINGGYKKYLLDKLEKERIEKEIYDNTKETLKVAKSSKRWVIITVIISVIAVVLTILWHYQILS